MYQNMTLRELKEKKLISGGDGRPCAGLTDEKWQQEFQIRRFLLTPYSNGERKLGRSCARESGVWNTATAGSYCGPTGWQAYCSYINDVLRNIRAGQVDYCYYMYQIMDLLRFHYEDLRTRLCDGYWEVWLDRP